MDFEDDCDVFGDDDDLEDEFEGDGFGAETAAVDGGVPEPIDDVGRALDFLPDYCDDIAEQFENILRFNGEEGFDSAFLQLLEFVATLVSENRITVRVLSHLLHSTLKENSSNASLWKIEALEFLYSTLRSVGKLDLDTARTKLNADARGELLSAVMAKSRATRERQQARDKRIVDHRKNGKKTRDVVLSAGTEGTASNAGAGAPHASKAGGSAAAPLCPSGAGATKQLEKASDTVKTTNSLPESSLREHGVVEDPSPAARLVEKAINTGAGAPRVSKAGGCAAAPLCPSGAGATKQLEKASDTFKTTNSLPRSSLREHEVIGASCPITKLPASGAGVSARDPRRKKGPRGSGRKA
jgi:hypothetical protein